MIFHDDVSLKLDTILSILQEKTVEGFPKTTELGTNESGRENSPSISNELTGDSSTGEITSHDEFMGVLEYLFMSMENPEQVIKLSSLLRDVGVQGGIHAVADEEILFFNSMIVDEKRKAIHYLKNRKEVFTVFTDSITDLKIKISCGVHELTIWINESDEVRIAFSF